MFFDNTSENKAGNEVTRMCVIARMVCSRKQYYTLCMYDIDLYSDGKLYQTIIQQPDKLNTIEILHTNEKSCLILFVCRRLCVGFLPGLDRCRISVKTTPEIADPYAKINRLMENWGLDHL